MRNFRSWLAALIALVFATTMGAAGAQNIKNFTLDSVTISGNTLTAKFTNVDSGNSTFNSLSLKATGTGATVTFTGVASASPGNAGVASTSELGAKLLLTDISPVKKGKTVTVTATVNVTLGGGECAPTVGWQPGAWTGSISSPSTNFVQVTPPTPTTSFNGNCSLAFTDTPTSLLRNGGSVDPFQVKAALKDGAGNVITTFTDPVTLAATAGCSFTSTPSANAVAGVATLSNLTPLVPASSSSCSIKASTTYQSVSYSTAVAKITVFDGELECNQSATPVFDARDLPASPSTAGYFDESQGGADAEGEPGLVTGVRGNGHLKGEETPTCPTLLNYTVVNNILATTPTTDPFGNTVPAGFYSFTFDAASVPSPIVAIMSSYKPEWSDPNTGLPTRKTLICGTVSGDCPTGPYDGSGNVIGGWVVAPSCLGTAVARSSIPAGTLGGCVARETWWPVASPNCTATPPTGPNVRCLQVTSTVIIGKDPVFGR